MPDSNEIVPCLMHSSDQQLVPYDEDCETCRAEAMARQSQMAQLMRLNAKTMQTLSNLQYQDPILPLALRLDMLAQFIMAGNGRMRQHFEILYHQQLQESLGEVLSQVRKAQITQGIGNITKIKRG